MRPFPIDRAAAVVGARRTGEHAEAPRARAIARSDDAADDGSGRTGWAPRAWCATAATSVDNATSEPYSIVHLPPRAVRRGPSIPTLPTLTPNGPGPWAPTP